MCVSDELSDVLIIHYDVPAESRVVSFRTQLFDDLCEAGRVRHGKADEDEDEPKYFALLSAVPSQVFYASDL